MGTGSSRSAALINMAEDATRLNSVNINSYHENLSEEKEIATEVQNAEAQDNVDPTSLLTSFSEKYPDIAPTLTATKDHYQALKEARSDGNLISLAALEHVKGLYNVYIQDKSPKNRLALTEFAVALGIPKLAYEIIVDCTINYQEITTWDRKEDLERTKGKGTVDEMSVSAEDQVICGHGYA